MQTVNTVLIAALLFFSVLAAGFACLAYLTLRRIASEAQTSSDDTVDALMDGVAGAKRDLLFAVSQTDSRLTQAMTGLMSFVSQSQNGAADSVAKLSAAAQGELKEMNAKLAREFLLLQGMVDERFAKVLSANAAQSSMLAEQQAKELERVRGTVSEALEKVRTDNAQKLEAMRATVQEKLEHTLSERLATSFKTVDEKLGLVQSGLGEMRRMAESVSKLQGILANVKTRGIFGETQLSAILSEILTPQQYGEQVRLFPDSNVVVDFAVRLPGRGDDAPCWLPIDAKFPLEDWTALVEAERDADRARADEARKQLERAIWKQAKSIREKYVRAPYTTEFAVMFLPSEGLYAEVLRMPGLFERLQRELRITPAGPVVISALLNSLLMGFMTLAMEKRSADVWALLGEVKTEFESFTKQFAVVEKKFREAQTSLEQMNTRTRAFEKRMRAIDLAEESGAGAARIESCGALDGLPASLIVDAVHTRSPAATVGGDADNATAAPMHAPQVGAPENDSSNARAALG